jgi:hypothetical protein
VVDGIVAESFEVPLTLVTTLARLEPLGPRHNLAESERIDAGMNRRDPRTFALRWFRELPLHDQLRGLGIQIPGQVNQSPALTAKI